ncbi:MAG: hypothetical protein ACI9S6_003499, partial [Reinekea sp.]
MVAMVRRVAVSPLSGRCSRILRRLASASMPQISDQPADGNSAYFSGQFLLIGLRFKHRTQPRWLGDWPRVCEPWMAILSVQGRIHRDRGRSLSHLGV